MTTYNAGKILFEEEDERNSSKGHAPPDNINIVKNDTTDESCLVKLKRDVVFGPAINDSLQSDNTNSQFNMEAKCLQPKKIRRRRRRLKDEDAPIEMHVNTSTMMDDSNGTNSCHDSLTETSAKVDLKTDALLVSSITKKKRVRKRQKLNSSGISNEVVVVDSPINNCSESGNTDSQFNIEAKCPLPKINNRKRRRKDKDASIDIHVDASRPKDDSVGINSCHDPLIEATVKTGFKTTALPVLSRSKKKRMRKKQKLNSSGITNEVHVSVADLDLTGTDENALMSQKQSDSLGNGCASQVNEHNVDAALTLVEKENIKKKKNKRKKQKLGASVISDNAHHPLPELDVVGMQGNGLLSDKRSEMRSPIVNTVEKHDNNGEGAFISNANGNVKKKKNRRKKKKLKSDTSIISVNTLTHADTDVVGMEGNTFDKQSDSISPSFNIVAKHDNTGDGAFISDGNENSKRKRKRKRKKKQKLNKKLLILDVNGLLVDVVGGRRPDRKPDIIVSRKAVFKRPFCDDFLKFCFQKFNVGVWSSRRKSNLNKILNFLMPDYQHKLLFVWDVHRCTRTGCVTAPDSKKPLFLKELIKLWDKQKPDLPWEKGEYNESNTLLLDDSPAKALCNPANTAIFPHPYSFMDATDSSLGPGGDLRLYLEKLAGAENVQEYVGRNPFGQEAITESNACSFFQEVFRKISEKKKAQALTMPEDPAKKIREVRTFLQRVVELVEKEERVQ